MARAKERDVNESDTVTYVTDMLEQVFGFDKYTDITREFSIQGTYCDLAIRTGKRVECLIEVKAIGIKLNSKHLRQVVNYAAQQGVNWIVLTNGLQWQIHRVNVEGRVRNELLVAYDFTDINARKKEQQELLYLLCKRGVQKDLIDDYYEYKQSVNQYTVGALLLTDSVTNLVRKELRKLKTVKVTADEIRELLKNEVIKRDVLDSDDGIEAGKQLKKMMRKKERAGKGTKPKDG